jgi:hypothetical protein
MKVSMVSNNAYNSKSNVHFKGIVQGLNNAIVVQDEKISSKAIKLVKALDDLIERTWKDIKNKNNISDSPLYMSKTDKDTIVVIRPVYTQKYPAVLFEVNNKKYFENILVNRKKPSNFRYEKGILTDHGSATLKTYNSLLEDDDKINTKVNNILENSIDKVLPHHVFLEHFDIEAFKNGHESLLTDF